MNSLHLLRYIVVFVGFFVAGLSDVLSQNNAAYAWDLGFGGEDDEIVMHLDLDAYGNVYLYGRFTDSVDFNQGSEVAFLDGDNNIFIHKSDSEGQFLWVRSIVASQFLNYNTLAVDSLGNVFLSGEYRGDLNLNSPGGSQVQIASSSQSSSFIFKLNPSGDLEWVHEFSSDSNLDSQCLAVDSSGFVYSFGQFSDSVDLDPGPDTSMVYSAEGKLTYIQKFDSNGNLVFSKEGGGANFMRITSAVIDPFGNIVLGGEFQGEGDFDIGIDTTLLQSSGNYDIFIQKLAPNGDFIWAKSFGGSQIDYLQELDCDAFGNIFSTGNFMNFVDFDPGPDEYNLQSVGSWDIFVSKLNSNGNFVWAQSYGSDQSNQGFGIHVGRDGDVYCTGRFGYTVDFDFDEVDQTNLVADNIDLFILSLSNEGDFGWVKQIGGSNHDFGAGVKTDQSNNLFIAGSIRNTVDFDPSVNSAPGVSNGDWDAFVVKLTPCFLTEMIPNLDNLPPLTNPCSIYPETPFAFNGCDLITGQCAAEFPLEMQTDTSIAWRYIDEVHEMVVQYQAIHIEDNAIPVPDMDELPVLVSQCGFDSLPIPTASDNCNELIAGSTEFLFPITEEGSYTVEWIFDDGNGNTGSQLQQIIIEDDELPELVESTLPEIFVLCRVDNSDAFPPNAIDNCQGEIEGIANHTFPIEDQSITEIIWTFDDGNGNTVTQSQPIIWQDIDVNISVEGNTITANNEDATYQWVDCDNSFAEIFNEDNQAFTPIFNGNYAVEVTQDGCVSVSECVFISTVGINDLGKSGIFNVYPNPSTGVFYVSFYSPIEDAQLTVTDLRGRVVFTKHIQNSAIVSVELEEAPGIYLLMVQSAEGVQTVRLVKQ